MYYNPKRHDDAVLEPRTEERIRSITAVGIVLVLGAAPLLWLQLNGHAGWLGYRPQRWLIGLLVLIIGFFLRR